MTKLHKNKMDDDSFSISPQNSQHKILQRRKSKKKEDKSVKHRKDKCENNLQFVCRKIKCFILDSILNHLCSDRLFAFKYFQEDFVKNFYNFSPDDILVYNISRFTLSKTSISKLIYCFQAQDSFS